MPLPKIISFYLPQFHENDLNNKNWGKGFTEWTNVAKARPNFHSHYQPHIPQDLGFYDLTNIQSLEKQIKLASKYGIDGFCFYYYWFDGEKALYKPLNIFLESKLVFPFCICWANENWTKNWDGGNKEIILEQTYKQGFEDAFVKSIKNILIDSRYIKIDNKPLLLIYRPDQFPNPNKNLDQIRAAARKYGIGEISLAVVDAFCLDLVSASKWGEGTTIDYIIEFPPHGYFTNETRLSKQDRPLICNSEFQGKLYDYRKIVLKSLQKSLPQEVNKKYIRGIIPSWDNTPRRQNTSSVCCKVSSQCYFYWLKYLIGESISYNRKAIFVNAWNEWGEGAHLEPDLMNGLSFLEKTKLAIDSSHNVFKDREDLVDYLNNNSNADSLMFEKLIQAKYLRPSFRNIIDFLIHTFIRRFLPKNIFQLI